MNRVIESHHIRGMQVSKSVYPIFLQFYSFCIVKNSSKWLDNQWKYLKNATKNIILCLKALHFVQWNRFFTMFRMTKIGGKKLRIIPNFVRYN
jgi:hypothetical protein